MKRWWMIILFTCAAFSTSNEASAQLVLKPAISTRTCQDIASDIQSANMRLSSLQAQKSAAEVNYNTVKLNWATASANAVNYPLYSTYYQALATMYLTQAFFIGSHIIDLQHSIDQVTSEIQSLNTEYSARGC